MIKHFGGKKSRMDIYKKIEKINDADKLVTHKRELQQCEFYMYMLTMPLLDEQPFHEAERFANNMYEKIKKESPSIALCNTALTPRYTDSVNNLKINLQAIHTMLMEIMGKEAKDIVDQD